MKFQFKKGTKSTSYDEKIVIDYATFAIFEIASVDVVRA